MIKRTFPILDHHVWDQKSRSWKNFPIVSIPWEKIEPHREQAYENHSQTLERLAERRGLSACEAVAVLQDKKWAHMEREDAFRKLSELIN